MSQAGDAKETARQAVRMQSDDPELLICAISADGAATESSRRDSPTPGRVMRNVLAGLRTLFSIGVALLLCLILYMAFSKILYLLLLWLWPAGLYLVLCVAALVAILHVDKSGVWFKAARVVLLPAAAGFAALLLAIPILHVFVSNDSLTFGRIDVINIAVWRFHEHLKHIEHLDLKRWLLIGALIPLTRACYSIHVVDGVLSAKRALSSLLTFLAVTTSFSFIADDNVSGGVREEVAQNVRLSLSVRLDQAGYYLSTAANARAMAKAISTANPSDLKILAHIVSVGEQFTKDQKVTDQDAVFSSLTDAFFGRRWRANQHNSLQAAEEEYGKDALQEFEQTADEMMASDPFEALRIAEQFDNESVTLSREARQAAVKEMLKAAFGILPERATPFVLDWVEHIVDIRTSPFTELVNKVLRKRVESVFDSLTDPAVDEAAGLVSAHLDKRWAQIGSRDDLQQLDVVVRDSATEYVAEAVNYREREKMRVEQERTRAAGVERPRTSERFEVIGR